MEGFSLSEQPESEIRLEPAQEPKKGRSPEEKIGRIKWNSILLNRVLDEIQKIRDEMKAENRQIREEMKQLRVMQRTIVNGFKGYGLLKYTVPMVQQRVCVDQVDVDILETVFRVGNLGVYPRVIAKDLNAVSSYGLNRFSVSYRIERMNRRSMDEFSECLFEMRSQKWALTSFAFDTYGETDVANGQKGGECNAV
jgi:hypothetical protein